MEDNASVMTTVASLHVKSGDHEALLLSKTFEFFQLVLQFNYQKALLVQNPNVQGRGVKRVWEVWGVGEGGGG